MELTAFLRLLFLFMEANKAEPSSRRAPVTSYIKAEVSEVEAQQQTNVSETTQCLQVARPPRGAEGPNTRITV